MCGIFGYYNYNVSKTRQHILDILLAGLVRLEYRGYDSAGLCLDDECVEVPSEEEAAAHSKANGVILRKKPFIIKTKGMISELRSLCGSSFTGIELEKTINNHVGIAHTRWATHGAPSAINSHPQYSDPNYEFVVVHNGIITNFQYLKDYLVKHGETFISDTDTEVIPKLCKYLFQHLNEDLPFPKLVMEVMRQLEGAYALLFKSVHYPGELVACKCGSPLIIGFTSAEHPLIHQVMTSTDIGWRASSMECWLASDPSAVVEHTKKVIVMEDNDVLHLCRGGYGIFNADNTNDYSAVDRVVQTLEIEVEQIKKGGFDHYMQKEIHEQPASLLQTMRGRTKFERLESGNPYLYPRVNLGGLAQYIDVIRRSRRIVFVASGTSYNACLATRQTVEEMCDVPVVLEISSDFVDRECPIFRDDTCVFVSQSGETADTLQALNYAKSKGAMLVGITNTVGSAISRATDCGVHLNAGYEIGVASTKAYGSEILAITMMALSLAEDSISKRTKRDIIIDEMADLPSKVKRVLELDGTIKHLAEKLKDEQSLLFFGRGYNYATAVEGALKVKEVALIHSEGILAGEIKHGPLALVDENLPIIVIATKDNMHKKMLSVVQQLCARHARLIVICNEGDNVIRQNIHTDATFIEVRDNVLTRHEVALV